MNDSVYTRGRNALSAAMMSNGGGVCRNAQMQTLFAVIDNTSRVTLNHAFVGGSIPPSVSLLKFSFFVLMRNTARKLIN